MTRRKRRQIAIAGATATGVTVVALALVLGGDDLLSGGMAGTMGAAGSAVTLADASAGWEIARAGGIGRLDDAVEVRFSAKNPSDTDRDVEFEVYVSRDDKFDPASDCLVERRTETVPAGGSTPIVLRTAGYLVDCLDAGPWRVAVRTGGAFQILPDRIVLENGPSRVELADLPGNVGFGAPLELAVHVDRETNAYGVPGLYEQPVDIWLKKGDTICVIDAPPATLPRDPIRRAVTPSHRDRLSLKVETRTARRVQPGPEFIDPFLQPAAGVPDRHCPGCQAIATAGACRLDEGEWQVAAGPSVRGFAAIRTTYVHARPVSVDASTIQVTAVSGQLAYADLKIVNPGRRAVKWSLASDRDGDWLVAQSDAAKSGESRVQLTISANRLQPGFYSGTYRFRADDFYGTEIEVPVELRVERNQREALSGFGGDPGTPGGSFSLENYPNPFRGSTTVRIRLQDGGMTRVAVYDVSGREVRTLVEEYMGPGQHEVTFDAGDLPSGTYLCRMTSAEGSVSKTMTVVR